MGEVEEGAVDDEEDVDDDEEVVGVPEGVEAGEAVQGLGEVEAAAAEPGRGQRERDGHQHHHHDPRPPLRALHEPPVVVRPRVPEEGPHRHVRLVARVQQPREVARQVRYRVQPDPDRNPHRNHLLQTQQ